MAYKFKPFKPPTHKKSRKLVELRTSVGYQNHNEMRAKVLARDNHQCQNPINGRRCLRPATDVHHIIPTERGGLSVARNMISLCYDCHCNQPGHGHMRKNDARNGKGRGKTAPAPAPVSSRIKPAEW